MNYKELTLKLRTQGILRGERPCVVCIPKNDGKVYSDKKSTFYVMTITQDNMLYFHGLTRWFKDYLPEKDFKIKLSALKCYTVDNKNKITKLYTFSTKEGLFFPIEVLTGLKDTYETDVNLEAILRRVRSLGIKEEKYE